MNIGFWEIMLIFLVILLLFGARKLPGLARSLGQSIGEFKKGMRDEGKSPADSADGQQAGSSDRNAKP